MQFLRNVALLGATGLGGGWIITQADEAGVDLWKFVQKLIPKGGAGGGADSRVDQLAQDVRALMLQGGSKSTLVVSSGGSGSGKLMLLILPGTGIYLWLKGYRLSDLQWVSRASFAQAVDSIGKAQESLSNGLSTFRAAVSKKLLEFQAQVEERFAEVQRSTEQIEAQVSAVEDLTRSVQGNVSVVDLRVQGLTRKLDETQAQLAYTSKGIHLLCSVVSENMSGASRSARELEQFAQFNPLEGPTQWEALEGPAVLVDRPSPVPGSDSEAGERPSSGTFSVGASAHTLSLFGHKSVLASVNRTSALQASQSQSATVSPTDDGASSAAGAPLSKTM